VENKHGGQYGKQIVTILDSLMGNRDWCIEWSKRGKDGIYYRSLHMHELLELPDIQAAQDYIKEKEDL